MGSRLLPREDADVADIVCAAQKEAGITVLTDHAAVGFDCVDGQRRLIVEHAGVKRTLDYDALIIAVGRKARLTGYGLEELGVKSEEHTSELPSLMRNSYAVFC